MKNFLQIWLVPVVLLSGSTLFSCNDPVDVKPTLTNAEVETLNFMIQEEKLARDVYTYFFDLYGLNIFGNISGSEQKHMDKVRDLMIAYDLEVNVPEAAGVFSIDALQTLYNDLILSGEQSLLDALIVGATIEDKDIFDLNESIAATDNADLIEVFEILKCASGNHMRAFYGQLTDRGGTYTAQFITPALLDEVLAGEHEQCAD